MKSRSLDLVRWEVNGRYLGLRPITGDELRSARRWSRRLTLIEMKLASEFIKRRVLNRGPS